MSKDKISDYSTTANSNTDIGGINVDEGCAPSGINDAIRTLMAQLKTWQSGGQDIYIHPAGTASAPSITANGDTNTGIFFPAADTVGITTGGTERARVDSSGNLGLGVTPSAWSGARAFQIGTGGVATTALWDLSNNTFLTNGAYWNGTAYKYIANSFPAARYVQSNGVHTWATAAGGTAGNDITFSESMRLSASGYLGIGATSPSSPLHITCSSASGYLNGGIRINDTNTSSDFFLGGAGASGSFQIATAAGSTRMTIDSSGSLLVGTTTALDGGSTFVTSDATSALSANRQTTTAAYGVFGSYSSIGGANSLKSYTRADGGLANYSANNVNLSDERLKKDIAPAGSYLAKICAIPVKTFRYKDQEETEDLTLGVIAQEVQQIAPELVSQDGFGLSEEDKQDYLSIYQTDLQYALMKALQELKAEFDAYKASHP